MASASACSASWPLETHGASRRSFDRQNASLAVAMARGIKATLLCAHGPTVLTNPEPCSAMGWGWGLGLGLWIGVWGRPRTVVGNPIDNPL